MFVIMSVNGSQRIFRLTRNKQSFYLKTQISADFRGFYLIRVNLR